MKPSSAPQSQAEASAGPEQHTDLHPIVVDALKVSVGALLDKKGEQVTVLNVAGRTSVCDAIVVASGSHARHVSALADAIVRAWKDTHDGERPLGVEGAATGKWVLIDLGDVVVHLFDGPQRGYYDIEGLWMDARQVPLEDLGLEAPPPTSEWDLDLS